MNRNHQEKNNNTRNHRLPIVMITLLLLLALAPAALAKSRPAAGTPTRPKIEVCFVLDTTGSMGGLIEGAKRKIWAIANQMIAAKPTPELEIGLVGYRDRGDAYVTDRFDLSNDIDAVYAKLQEFQAGGGGDTPESVNQALHEAVTRIGWSRDRTVLKIIFLVGDCPPHMDYPDDVKYQQSCQAAVQRDLIINTVQCGSHGGTRPIWQEIAHLGEGSYVAIGQTGDMQEISTPMDAELARLNAALGKTLVPYGSRRRMASVMAKQEAAEMAPRAAVADRLAYNSATGKAVQGGGDLVDDLRKGEVTITELDAAELPAELREMSASEQQAYLDGKANERQQIQQQIDKLLAERRDFIARKTRELIEQGKGNSFDLQVAAILREQARRKGISLSGI